MTALQATSAALQRIAQHDRAINAFTDVLSDRAFARARALDSQPASSANGAWGELHGMPYAVKNLFDVAGLRTLAGSRIERDAAPAARDAYLVRRLEAAGAVCVGALNMDEYAYGFTTENTHEGPTRNPHDLTRISGGSSGGSAAAVAAGMVPLSLGSDTNGSIRVPASLCGVFGLKPTFGRLSRAGTYPFVASLDHLGPFAREVSTLAAAYDALQGQDPDDPAQEPRPFEPTLQLLDEGLGGLRIGVLGGWFEQMALPPARAAVAQVARALGVADSAPRVMWPDVAQGRTAAFIITNAEGAALHLSDLRTRADDFDPLTRDRFIAGALLPAAWVQQAHRVRHLFARKVAKVLESVDLLIAPATPGTAPLIGTEWMEINGQRLPSRASMGLLTQPVSAIGLPVACVPVWGQDADAPHLPIGVQLIAAPWREDLCLRAARVLERQGLCHAPVATAFQAKPVS